MLHNALFFIRVQKKLVLMSALPNIFTLLGHLRRQTVSPARVTRIPVTSPPPAPRQCLESEDDLQQLQSDGVPSEVTDWLASTFTQKVRRPARRSDEKPKFRSIVHAVQAGIFVERCVMSHNKVHAT